ncbi:hypothetical protein D9758_001012 [Tetrapyrgos nigripes]|uniref:[RNA-polymerase]-subunit kinase n=1 Tax=Tetrapyrgos nigripes TaxID=182062 RepID=A0A8H5GRW5_9AGAR|nr:hypothetical protein D9758_001012 [Tetrapyrgos nigripes]
MTSSSFFLPVNEKPWSIPGIHRFRKQLLSNAWEQTLDRANVLGDNHDYGHAGCVNALSWACDGELLLSGGDDTTVQIWRMDPGNTTKDYPFVCRTVINTGHRANIFNAQMLPYSSKIVTVAGDKEVRVFDVDTPSKYSTERAEYSASQCRTHTFSCHEDRVKRIITEGTPHLFLTVSEVNHDLSALALSPLTPYHIVVAGSSPYGYLFDRRFTGRDVQMEAGMDSDGLTTCVRRFGRTGKTENSEQAYMLGEHITGARMSSENGHEVLLSYSGDGVYLFSTLDDPEDPEDSPAPETKTSLKSKRRRLSDSEEQLPAYSSSSDTDPLPVERDEDEEDEGDEDSDEEEIHDEEMDPPEELYQPGVPIIRPRRRYAGARNVDTVKDVNFLGPFDEYVASGSDDGNFFIWEKTSGRLHGLYEGDGNVVNVIEPHPHLPLVAVSGIDHTVKLFAPSDGSSEFSRIDNAENIMRQNSERRRNFHTLRRIDLVALLTSMRAASASGGQLGEASDCALVRSETGKKRASNLFVKFVDFYKVYLLPPSGLHLFNVWPYMRSQGKPQRKHRHNKGYDDEQLVPHDDPQSYSRHLNSQHSDNYKTHHSSSRSSYDMNRHSSSSRGHHDSHSWHDAQDSYAYQDSYHRSGRDDFETRERDDGWNTRRNKESHSLPLQREEWPARYDNGYSASYQDPVAWPNAHYDDSHASYARWPEDDLPAPMDDLRTLQEPLREREPDTRWDRGHQRDPRRDRATGSNAVELDMGWQPHYQENRSGWDERPALNQPTKQRAPSPVDRQWEPAASWKSTHRNETHTQHSQNGHRNHNHHSNARQNGKKNNHSHHNKGRRDWRNDDGNLNNWGKKEGYTHEKGSKSANRRKHQRSYSHSRSRSPAEETHYSRYSSLGRSRSRSISPAPKRLRRESSPSGRGRSPDKNSDRHSDRDRYSEWVPPEKQSPVSQRGRRRSVSSTSTPSTDRSRSPTRRARAVHRLPSTSTPAKDVVSRGLPSAFGPEPVTHETTKTNRHHKKKKNRKNNQLSQTLSVETMPPPSLPSNTVSRQRQRVTPPPPSFVPASVPSWSEQDETPSLERQSPPYMMMRPLEPPSPPPPPRVDAYYSTTIHSDRDISSREPPVFVPGPSGFLEPTIPPPAPPTTSSTAYPRFVPASSSASGYTGNTISEYVSVSVPETHPSPVHDQHPREHYQYHEEVSWRSELQVLPQRAEPTRVAPIKHAGFKPIGSSNPAVKRFFPDDEEDMDIADSPTHTDAPAPPQPSSSHAFSAAVEPDQAAEDVNDSVVQQELAENSRRDTDPHGQSSEGAVANAPSETSRPRSRTDLYTIVSQVGEGTFGKVYKARNTVTDRIRMESEKDGFPVTAMREIKLLQSLRHENVIRLYEMMVSSGSVYMVFEYMDHDLTGILSQTQFSFTDAHLKSLCLQMLAGLAYLHHKGVIHRDIKGSNILVNNRGELKLADFGLARFYQKRRRSDYTNRVITLWYRPPELLFGATIYGPEVDMWSAGCIMLELFTKKPVFQGNDEISQLDVIYRIIGTPTHERWSDAASMPWYELVKPKDHVPNHFRELFKKWMSPAALDLAERLLDYDPSRRATAVQAMDAPYFTEEEPAPERPIGLATLEGEWHELETKRERAKKRKKE